MHEWCQDSLNTRKYVIWVQFAVIQAKNTTHSALPNHRHKTADIFFHPKDTRRLKMSEPSGSFSGHIILIEIVPIRPNRLLYYISEGDIWIEELWKLFSPWVGFRVVNCVHCVARKLFASFPSASDDPLQQIRYMISKLMCAIIQTTYWLFLSLRVSESTTGLM